MLRRMIMIWNLLYFLMDDYIELNCFAIIGKIEKNGLLF